MHALNGTADMPEDNSSPKDSNIALLREVSASLLDPEIAISLFDDAPDPYIVINAQMKIELVNKQAERLLGYDRTELYDVLLNKVLHPDAVLAPLSTILDTSLSPDFAKSVTVSVTPKTGEPFDVSLHFALIIAIQGTYVGITMRKIEASANAAKG
jgi:PAS domain S-box-containing protein